MGGRYTVGLVVAHALLIIWGYAIPELDKEALAAGRGQIDTVSGATYTSEGYIASLQSALDKAGI